MLSGAGPGPTMEGMSPWFRKFLIFVGACAAIALGVQRAMVVVAERRARKERVTEDIQKAAKQSAEGRHQAAWLALQQAKGIESDREDVRLAQEDVAMAWLRRIRVTRGQETFTDIVTKVQPTLMR